MMHDALGRLAATLCALAALAALAWLVAITYRAFLRSRFEARYGVRVPSSVRLRRRAAGADPIGTLRLAYPRWQAAKRDGTRDLRTNDMRVLKPSSHLDIGAWSASGGDPFAIYRLALDLRAGGHTVAYCAEERAKRRQVMERLHARRDATSAANIVARFRQRPTDFERFCADVFIRLGWSAEVTPPSRDGGVDIRMRDPDGMSYIAECKCYEPSHRVGRPVIQKLQGANSVAGAEGMMVITTSSFSQDAEAYARQVGVRLIDGTRLVRLCDQAFGESARTPAIAPESAVTLTRADLMSRIPEDLRDRY